VNNSGSLHVKKTAIAYLLTTNINGLEVSLASLFSSDPTSQRDFLRGRPPRRSHTGQTGLPWRLVAFTICYPDSYLVVVAI
jgi:hypothetical protein